MSPFKDVEEMTPAQRWTIAFTVVFGAFIAIMDTSVVNVSMTHMMRSFGTDLSSITWVATSYSIAEIIMVTMAGWWSSLLGRKKFYLALIRTVHRGIHPLRNSLNLSANDHLPGHPRR